MKADISFRETYCITNNKKCEHRVEKSRKRKAKQNAFSSDPRVIMELLHWEPEEEE